MLIEINDFLNAKIIYISDEDNTIEAHYFSNHEQLDDDAISEQINNGNDNTLELKVAGSVVVEEGYLSEIEVDELYRNRGIGTKLVELAIKHLMLEKIACVKEHENYHYCLTLKGEHLIASCIRKGIVTEEMCVLPPHPDLLEDDVNEDEDPELVSIIIQEALEQPLPTDKKKNGVINTLYNYFRINDVDAKHESENTERQNRANRLNFSS